jgi:protein involved in polysaccharide export with SLBB domain
MLAGLLALGGCETKGFLDPGEMMRTTKEPLTVPVLPSLAQGLDETEPEFAAATDVRQEDLKVSATDYVVGRNDLLQISLSDVGAQGIEQIKTSRVSESGNVSLPLIGPVKAAGLTEADLEKSIAQVYRDRNLIQNAQVSVTVLEARQRTFSVLDAVARPGQYQIVQSDFRMLDALTLAGGVQIQGIEHAYIIRKKPEDAGAATQPAAPGTTTPPPGGTTTPPPPRPDPLEGNRQGRGNLNGNSAVARAASVARPVHLSQLDAPDTIDGSEGGRKIMVDGKWVPVKSTTAQPAATAGDATAAPAPAPVTPTATVQPGAASGGVSGTSAGDTLAPSRADTGAPTAPAAGTGTTGAGAAAVPSGAADTGSPGFQFDAPQPDTETRIIRVPLARLLRGELQYNVVIRPNDTIIIPSPKVGEYYMGGHVQRAGVYSLTGRDITLKQAIISAGMIDPLGWPERTEVIRRVGRDRELFVRVNIPKIFAGEQPDIYLRPYDTVNVGTNALAPFLAAVRGAFRFTYGFGFIYDRNFYDENNNFNN